MEFLAALVAADVGLNTIGSAISAIASLCQQMKHSSAICKRVLTRFQDIYDELEKLQATGQRLSVQSKLAEYANVLHMFLTFLLKYAEASLVTRLMKHSTMLDELKHIHEEIDTLMTVLHLSNTRTLVTWRAQWEEDTREQMKLLTTLVGNSTAVQHEVSGLRAQIEAMTMIKYAEQSHAERSDEMLRVMKKLYNQLECQSKAEVSPVPKWFIPSSDVTYEKTPFDEGSFGKVHHGQWNSGARVVVKTLRVDALVGGGNRAMRNKILKEIDIWSDLSHPNVIKMYGACHVSDPPFIVCEEAKNGNMCTFLGRSSVHQTTMWQLLSQAALGLEYLHKSKIVHGDLKLNNILVSVDGKAQLADFGLSTVRSSSSSTAYQVNGTEQNRRTGALRWSAPECTKTQGKPRFESDIYSLGMCIIEAATGEPPFGMMRDDIVIQRLCQGVIPDQPQELDDEAWALVTAMTTFQPSQRCSIAQVKAKLQHFADTRPSQLRMTQIPWSSTSPATLSRSTRVDGERLHQLLKDDNVAGVDSLLDSSDALEAQVSWSGMTTTPLAFAALLGACNVSTNLIARGANVRVKTALSAIEDSGCSLLHLAASNGHSKIVGMLLRSHADLLDQVTDKQRSALYYAVRFGHVKVVHVLLRFNADLRIRTEEDTGTVTTALVIAAFYDWPNCVVRLLQSDKCTDADKRQALAIATAKGNRRTVDVLRQRGVRPLLPQVTPEGIREGGPGDRSADDIRASSRPIPGMWLAASLCGLTIGYQVAFNEALASIALIDRYEPSSYDDIHREICRGYAAATARDNWLYDYSCRSDATSADELHRNSERVFLAGCLIGCILCSYFADAIGRRLTAIGGCAVLAVGILVVWAIPRDIFAWQLGVQGVQGIGVGTISLVFPIYGAELAPTNRRGLMAGSIQLAVALGALVGRIIAKEQLFSTWRLPLTVSASAPMLATIIIFQLPESRRRRGIENRESGVQQMDQSGLQWIDHTMSRDELMAQEANSRMLFFSTQNLQRVALVAVMQMLQHLSGIHAMFFYRRQIATWLDSSIALPLAFTVAAGFVVVDCVGRRTLLIAGGAGMFLATLTITGSFVANCSAKEYPTEMECDDPFGLVIGVAACAFVASFALSWGLLCWIYPTEIFPSHLRVRSVAISTASYWMVATAVRWIIVEKSVVTPTVSFVTSLVGSMGCVAVAFFWCTETKGLSLELAAYRFDLGTKTSRYAPLTTPGALV